MLQILLEKGVDLFSGRSGKGNGEGGTLAILPTTSRFWMEEVTTSFWHFHVSGQIAAHATCISVHDGSNLRDALGLRLLWSLPMLRCFLCYPARPCGIRSSVPCHVVAPDARLRSRFGSGAHASRSAAPQGPPRGAPADGDARSKAGVRWGPPAIAHALPRAAQPVSF